MQLSSVAFLLSPAQSTETNPQLVGLDFGIFNRAKLSEWDPANFTDPNNHGQTYRYLVNAISETKPIANLDRYFAPEFTDKSDLVSLSLISEAKNITWGPSGFIIRAPKENILAMNYHDMFSGRFGSNVSTESKQRVLLDIRNRGFGFVSPAELLNATSDKYNDLMHNEVVALAKGVEGRPLEVVGIFAKTDSLGTPFVSSNDYETLKREASRRGVPFITLSPGPSRRTPSRYWKP
jgi:hypothetical protein